MMIIDNIGTLEWSKRTGGKLSRKEHEALLKEQVARQASAMAPDQLPGINASERGMARMDIDKIRIPDSSVARQAEALVAELSPPSLTHHCYRTYLWGSLLAQHDAIRVDEELFYVTSLLHDLGATDKYFRRNPRIHCFAVESAMAADEFLAREGWNQTRRDIVAEAITLHLNMSVDLSHGPVAHCLSIGTQCDVLGQRASEIPRPAINEVLHRHPGLGFAKGFAQFLAAEAQAHPEGRYAFNQAHFDLGEVFPLGKEENA